MRKMTLIAFGAAAVLFAVGAVAQKPIIYPAKGQSPQQQQKDDGECYVWAKNSTGVDPVALAQTPPPQQPPPPQGQAAKGALRGAAGGAIIAEVADGDAGRGAAAGAVVGGARGAHKAQQQQAAQQQKQAQSQQQQQQAINTYYRAFGACMEGRGYTVK